MFEHLVSTDSPDPRRHPFGSGHYPYPAGYAGRSAEGRPWCPEFPLPFGYRHSLLGPSCSRPGDRPSSRSAHRPAKAGRTPSGFPRSTQLRHDRVGCPLYPGDGGVLPVGGSLSDRHPPLRCGQSLHPAGIFRLAGPKRDEASSGGSLTFTRPVFPLPVAPGRIGDSWASSSSSAPHRYQ